MGKDTVVLSGNEAISDLFEKRSSIYSDKVGGAITPGTLPFLTFGRRHKQL